ncbi:MAG TPA: GDP-mannose 4,6-dehydratase [Terriglobales bacterium]|nr:GDP-mannose 4,6-dehydratase [Terriglobales bacterium]
MKLKGKKVFVTGAGGFVGSHMVEELVKIGARVRGLVHYNSRNDWGMLECLDKNVLSGVEVVTGDIRDGEALKWMIKGQDVVFHLAALIGIPYSYVNPRDVVETNVLGSLNLLLAALDSSVEKIVHTSTSEVYGTAKYVPMDEKHPLNPQSPYAASKVSADQVALSFYRSFSLPVGIIRPFNIYGPRQSARAVIPNMIIQGLEGSRLKLGSVFPTRDLTYVKDAVQGFISFAQSDKTVGEVVNLGTGKEVSISELVDLTGLKLSKNLKPKSDKKRVRPKKSEVGRLVANVSKAKKLFKWNPKTYLETGIEKTICWMKENSWRYKKEIYNI